jgi:putative transposase
VPDKRTEDDSMPGVSVDTPSNELSGTECLTYKMSNYRRLFVPGGTYSFTVVTANRAPLFSSARARRLLGQIMRECFARRPVQTIAQVLLPEHLHAIWALPPDDADYSVRWRWIKRELTRAWLARGGCEQSGNPGAQRERRRGIWQRRFWEHTIRDERDLEAHFDYIHYNPVKHGLARSPREWPWSTFHRWVRSGHYNAAWARAPDEKKLPGGAGE